MLTFASLRRQLTPAVLLLFAVLLPLPATASSVWDFQFQAIGLSEPLSVSGRVAFNTLSSENPTDATEANLAQVAALNWQWNVFGNLRGCVGVTECLRSARWVIDNGELKELELHSLSFEIDASTWVLAGIVAAAIAIPIISVEDDSNGPQVPQIFEAEGTVTETPAPGAGLLLLSALSGLAAIAGKRRRALRDA